MPLSPPPKDLSNAAKPAWDWDVFRALTGARVPATYQNKWRVIGYVDNIPIYYDGPCPLKAIEGQRVLVFGFYEDGEPKFMTASKWLSGEWQHPQQVRADKAAAAAKKANARQRVITDAVADGDTAQLSKLTPTSLARLFSKAVSSKDKWLLKALVLEAAKRVEKPGPASAVRGRVPSKSDTDKRAAWAQYMREYRARKAKERTSR